ncbi:hypothetical protein [Gymnodinialimonas ulvae]|uniref:hypothetical protein n=1 Tax=Gymnodinialimonas ulvae TaxID=3126504 RepID=UPI0030AAA21C
MRFRVIAMLLAGLIATHAAAQVRQADVTAAAILTGFVNADVAAIQRHATTVSALRLQRIVDGEIDAATLFDPAAAQAAAQWDGQMHPARFERYLAVVPFAISGPDGPVSLSAGAGELYFVLRLARDTDYSPWGYQGVGRMPRASYEARAADPP